MYLSKHFTLEELTASQTASRFEIDNTPSPAVVDNLKRLCELILEPVRDIVHKPVQITSGYRCIALNRMIGSKDTSHHVLGLAADIKVPGVELDTLIKAIIGAGLPYEQVIREFDSWCHVSVSLSDKPKRQALIIDKLGTRAYS